MSLQPSDPAAEAFEHLRHEVSLLRRAVEGLASAADEPPVDYSPTLAELSEALARVDARTAALDEHPLLVLAPEQLVSLFQIAATKTLARSLAELDRARAALQTAAETVSAASRADLAMTGSRRRAFTVMGCGAVAGAALWGLSLGPLVRALPSAWGVPERLASAMLDLPMVSAGEQLLRRGDPKGWAAWQLAKGLLPAQLAQLRDCQSRRIADRAKPCMIRISSK